MFEILAASIGPCVAASIPLFGVCLGLQGVVEYFCGALATLQKPMHGKQSAQLGTRGGLFSGMPLQVRVGARLPAGMRSRGNSWSPATRGKTAKRAGLTLRREASLSDSHTVWFC